MRIVSTVLRLALLALLAPASHAAEVPAVVYSPYKYLPPFATPASPAALTWAFASGECGDEKWGGRDAQAVADASLPSFAQPGAGYIVSTGGQGNVFTCATDEGMERFIRRYESPQLIGFDFDIEAGQTPAQIASLAARIATAQQARPHLRMSFTVATHAASDGSMRSLNPTAEAVLAAVRAAGVQRYALNLMVMDYGPAARDVCVVRRVQGKARCDMGASALQAARNVHAKYGVPYEQIELTAMIGVNDVAENVFTLRDAQAVAQGVRRLKLAGLHYWSLDRDQPCRTPVAGADATCSSMQGVPAGAYLRTLARMLEQGAR